MLMRFPLIGVVVGGPVVPGQHVDKADLVRRIGLRTDRLEPRYTSLIAAERRSVPGDETGEAVGSRLKGLFFSVLSHRDRRLGNDLDGRSRIHFGEIGRLRCGDFRRGEGKRRPPSQLETPMMWKG